MNYTENRNEELLRKAAELGVEVVHPEDDQLLIDLDSQGDQYVMEALLPICAQHGLDIKVEKITKSIGGGKHAYLRANRPLGTSERILLQACLGSDRKRELLAFLLKGEAQTVFFEKAPF